MPSAIRRLARVFAALLAGVAIVFGLAPAASAHVVPTSTIQLDVGARAIRATVGIPVSDVAAATGLDLGNGSLAAVTSRTAAIERYLLAHFRPTGDNGRAWTVGSAAALTVGTTGNTATTGRYQELETTFTLTPPAGADERSFNLGYTAIVDRIATHVVIVTVRSDVKNQDANSAYTVGSISRSTVTNTVQPLHVKLGPGSEYRGFVSMISLGTNHIRQGTDHQLFLLTLLLPAPLLARNRRWAEAVPARKAGHRIATITLSFTLGHSITLALGALGLPVPQQLVEALIAVSILVAAVHAIRPLFPGREALVAASFGLVHGLAFSEALRALHLTGARLVLSLLGFNLGIEAMQLVVVALVLPPLILLARTGRYSRLRVTASAATALAAAGWLAARLGQPNPVAGLADRLGVIGLPIVLSLWLFALALTYRNGRQPEALVVFNELPARPSMNTRAMRWLKPGSAPRTG
jgi:hypothetical protein